MKNLGLVTLMLMVTSLNCFANSTHSGHYAEGWTPIKNEAFRSRFRLRGEVFLMDASGKKLMAPTTEVRVWQPGLKANKIDNRWSVSAKGIRESAIHHVWTLKDDNSLEVKIQQYDRFDEDKQNSKILKDGKLVREETLILTDFAPLSWVAETGKDYRVVLRFTPFLDSAKEIQTLDKIPIGGDSSRFEVTDNQGYLWADDCRFGGIFAALTSHRGSFIISFYPFKGAKEMGTAHGKVMELNLSNELSVKVKSDVEVVPGDMTVKVYGQFKPGLKTTTPNSRISYGENRLDSFPKEFF